MLELRIINAGQARPLFDLPVLLGRTAAARELGDAIEGLINFLDDLGGDPDVELNGDETDHINSEDDFVRHDTMDVAAGCPIADPAEDDDSDRCPAGDDIVAAGPAFCTHSSYSPGPAGSEDDEEPAAYTEWHTRGRRKTDSDGAEIYAKGRYGSALHEDAEEDDPDTGVEDHPLGFDPETDACLAGDDGVFAGAAFDFGTLRSFRRGDSIGDVDDGEWNCSPAYGVNQTLALTVTASNDY